MTNLSTQSGRANSFVVTPPDFGLALAQCRPVGGRFLLQLFLLFEVRDTIRVRRRVIQHFNSTPRPNAISICADLASEEQPRGPRQQQMRTHQPSELGENPWIDGKGQGHHAASPQVVDRKEVGLEINAAFY